MRLKKEICLQIPSAATPLLKMKLIPQLSITLLDSLGLKLERREEREKNGKEFQLCRNENILTVKMSAEWKQLTFF